MPDQPRLTDERLRELRDNEDICTNAGERSMAAELLELRARTRIGYVTGHHNAAGEWWIAFDSPPFGTLDEALADVQDARTVPGNDVPGIDWRALTVYDESGAPDRAQQEADRA
ncbi:hypothetical protein [Nocardia pseudovaccinii]|uniref:hypothetical protein n=1 Tax=Nocardia pseudovaccinii TaxID=189540 RepID=UPI0007A3C7EB|nr:hypothetical protein [Nocardia pseudovaccinii]